MLINIAIVYLDINERESNKESPCKNEGICENTTGGFTCNCKAVSGYKGKFVIRVISNDFNFFFYSHFLSIEIWNSKGCPGSAF